MQGEKEPQLAGLIRRVQLGDADAFARLVQEYSRHVYQTAYAIVRSRPDAEEVTQDVFIKIYRKLHTLKDPNAFPAWVTTITTRIAIDRFRQVQRRRSDPLETIEDIAQTRADPATRPIIEETLDALSPAHRAILLLRERDGYEYAEIADILSIPIGTVKSRLAYAKQAVRKQFGDPDEKENP